MRAHLLGLVLGAYVVTGAIGCAAERTPPGGWHGALVEPALSKPEFTLTATDGTSYSFRERTRGAVTLLFFGYTSCPDICPVHLSNIAAVLDRMPVSAQDSVRVVFVTTDPERDTPAKLRAWLDNFDHGFVGLRGSVDEVNRIQALLGLPAAVREAADRGADSSAYSVGHGAQVLAFTADDSLRVRYPFGVRQREWAEDIPRLLRVR